MEHVEEQPLGDLIPADGLSCAPEQLTDDEASIESMNVWPDGSQIVLSSDRSGPGEEDHFQPPSAPLYFSWLNDAGDIWVMDVDWSEE